MDALLTLFSSILTRLDARSVVDIVLVCGIIYWLLTLISGTSAATLVRGILILLIVAFALTYLLNLTLLGWLLRNAVPALFFTIPVLFAAELRRAFEQVGRAGSRLPVALPNFQRSPLAVVHRSHAAEIIAEAAERLSERRWGALIVLEGRTLLGEYAKSGVLIDAVLSTEILLSTFYPNSALHDGAVIVRDGRLLAAGVLLPLAQAPMAEHVGTRHRAAIGITENSDAIAVIVSEETGTISIANSGRMVRNLSPARLRTVLGFLDRAPDSAGHRPARLRRFLDRWSKNGKHVPPPTDPTNPDDDQSRQHSSDGSDFAHA